MGQFSKPGSKQTNAAQTTSEQAETTAQTASDLGTGASLGGDKDGAELGIAKDDVAKDNGGGAETATDETPQPIGTAVDGTGEHDKDVTENGGAVEEKTDSQENTQNDGGNESMEAQTEQPQVTDAPAIDKAIDTIIADLPTIDPDTPAAVISKLCVVLACLETRDDVVEMRGKEQFVAMFKELKKYTANTQTVANYDGYVTINRILALLVGDVPNTHIMSVAAVLALLDIEISDPEIFVKTGLTTHPLLKLNDE